MPAGHEGTAGGRTDGRHIVVVENDALVRQLVNVGRRDLFGPVETHIIPTLKIECGGVQRNKLF